MSSHRWASNHTPTIWRVHSSIHTGSSTPPPAHRSAHIPSVQHRWRTSLGRHTSVRYIFSLCRVHCQHKCDIGSTISKHSCAAVQYIACVEPQRTLLQRDLNTLAITEGADVSIPAAVCCSTAHKVPWREQTTVVGRNSLWELLLPEAIRTGLALWPSSLRQR